MADIADTAIQATFWTSLLFIIALGKIFPWWQHWYGRAMITIDILLVVSFAPAVAHLFDPALARDQWFDWLSITAFACIPLRTGWLLWAIWKIQRQEKIPA